MRIPLIDRIRAKVYTEFKYRKDSIMIDYIIIGIILLCVIFIGRYLYRQRRAGRGCCGSCTGCRHSCQARKEEDGPCEH